MIPDGHGSVPKGYYIISEFVPIDVDIVVAIVVVRSVDLWWSPENDDDRQLVMGSTPWWVEESYQPDGGAVVSYRPCPQQPDPHPHHDVECWILFSGSSW